MLLLLLACGARVCKTCERITTSCTSMSLRFYTFCDGRGLKQLPREKMSVESRGRRKYTYRVFCDKGKVFALLVLLLLQQRQRVSAHNRKFSRSDTAAAEGTDQTRNKDVLKVFPRMPQALTSKSRECFNVKCMVILKNLKRVLGHLSRFNPRWLCFLQKSSKTAASR